MSELRVSDAMTHLVVTFRPDDALPYAARRLAANRISGAPVVADGRVVGVVSDADLIASYAPARPDTSALPAPYAFTLLLRGTPPRSVDGTTVSDVMTTGVVSIGPDESIVAAAALMDRHGVRRLPVVDPDGYLVGIVARSDVVRCMAGTVEPPVLRESAGSDVRVVSA